MNRRSAAQLFHTVRNVYAAAALCCFVAAFTHQHPHPQQQNEHDHQQKQLLQPATSAWRKGQGYKDERSRMGVQVKEECKMERAKRGIQVSKYTA